MILVLERGTSQAELDAIVQELHGMGLGANVLGVADKPMIHVTSGRTRRARRLLRRNDRVQALIPTSGPRIRREGRRFYPYHFLNWCAGGLLLIGALVLLAGFFPPGVGADADPQRPMVDVPLPWYLQAPAAVLTLAPSGMRWLGWLVIAAAVSVLALLPMVDRSAGAGGSGGGARAPAVLLGSAIAAAYVALTLWRLL